MNYEVSFSEMNRLAVQTNLKPYKVSLEQMRKSVTEVRTKSQSKDNTKKVVFSYFC